MPAFERSDIREVLKRSYRIIYRIFEDRVDVLAVVEGHRRLPADLLAGVRLFRSEVRVLCVCCGAADPAS